VLDTKLQVRFTRSCTDAAFGYAAAASAAYAAFADQVLSFWADALQPPQQKAVPEPSTWFGFPFVRNDAAPMPFAWMMDTRWQPPTAHNAYGNASASPFDAWFGMFPITASPAAWSPAVWPMAFMLISAGVPRSVAWPTAEANVAVMDAADAAAVSVKQVFNSYQTSGGHAFAPFWSSAPFVSLTAFAPFNIGAMMTAFRFA